LDKAPEAFRTISEVAEALNVPQHVLRFWETRFVQIKPMKRGGGRRFYRPAEVDLLQGIRKLLYGEGYTIRGVQRILREEGVQFVASIGRGDTVARKRDARDLELDGVPQPGKAAPAPRIARPPALEPSVPPPVEPEAEKTDIAALPSKGQESIGKPADPREFVAKLSESQLESLRLALAELNAARKLLGSDSDKS
jgi:DNA-binding transcriptional MerR regulator